MSKVYLFTFFLISSLLNAQSDSLKEFVYPIFEIKNDSLLKIVTIAFQGFEECEPDDSYALSISIDVDNPIDAAFDQKDTVITITYHPLFYYEDSGPTHKGIVIHDGKTLFIRYSGIWSWFEPTGECMPFQVSVLPSLRKERFEYNSSSFILPSWMYPYENCFFHIVNGRIKIGNSCTCIELMTK